MHRNIFYCNFIDCMHFLFIVLLNLIKNALIVCWLEKARKKSMITSWNGKCSRFSKHVHISSFHSLGVNYDPEKVIKNKKTTITSKWQNYKPFWRSCLKFIGLYAHKLVGYNKMMVGVHCWSSLVVIIDCCCHRRCRVIDKKAWLYG